MSLEASARLERPTRGRAHAPRPAPTATRTRAMIQYDELRIEHDQGVVEIVVYNRAIPLFGTDSEAVRR